jgi:hypothetical protein
MSTPPPQNQETSAPTGAQGQPTLPALLPPDNERSSLPMAQQLPPAPLGRDETHERLVRLDSLLETLLAQKVDKGLVRNVHSPTEPTFVTATEKSSPERTQPDLVEQTSSYSTELPPVSELLSHSLPVSLVDRKDPFPTFAPVGFMASTRHRPLLQKHILHARRYFFAFSK